MTEKFQFYKETKFKDIPELGIKIPEDWEIKKLGEVAKFKRGFSYRSSDISEEKTSLRFITINDLEKEGGLKKSDKEVYLKEETKIFQEFLLEEGDILIANTDMSKGFIIGAPLLVNEELIKKYKKLVYSMDLTKLIYDKNKINSTYLFYYLTLDIIRTKMKSFSHGVNVLHLNHNLVRELIVILPPLEEQKAIAEILSTIDKTIEKVQEDIERTEKLKKGLMQKLLTGEIRIKEENGRLIFYKETKFKDIPELGIKIPEDWEIEKLGTILNLKNGKRPLNIFERGTVPIFGANGIMGYTDKFLVDNDYTIIIGRVGASGQIHLGSGKIWVSDNAIYSQGYDKSKTYLPFIFYLLKFKKLDQFISKTTHPIITKTFLNNLLVQFPPLKEQKAIAEILSTVDNKIELLKKKKELLEKVKKWFMQKLLTGEIRVKV